MVFEQFSKIFLPVLVLPINEIALIRGCLVSTSPTHSPVPCTMLITPLGTLALCKHSKKACVSSALNSLGLITRVQPSAIAGAILPQR